MHLPPQSSEQLDTLPASTKATLATPLQIQPINIRALGSFCLAFLLFFTLACSEMEKAYVEEKNGFLAVEAENYHSQELDQLRKWYRIDKHTRLDSLRDVDDSHAATASGNRYLEILPDTRSNHDEPLIPGENFSNQAGQLAILNYQVYINNPGKYYVWVRAYSTGTEDNGIHVGLDGQWVASGQRMQWCEGKNQWTWESKQRTQEVHCGVDEQIYLEIAEVGVHTISFSMREDGFEFDAWIIEKAYQKPDGLASFSSQ
ncbi:MAG: hypothetical protein AAF587_42965 [Bacteroidota bacterium]